MKKVCKTQIVLFFFSRFFVFKPQLSGPVLFPPLSFGWPLYKTKSSFSPFALPPSLLYTPSRNKNFTTLYESFSWFEIYTLSFFCAMGWTFFCPLHPFCAGHTPSYFLLSWSISCACYVMMYFLFFLLRCFIKIIFSFLSLPPACNSRSHGCKIRAYRRLKSACASFLSRSAL